MIAAMAVQRFPIELGHIMMFARSIGDPNPIYSDEEYAASSDVGHVIAPPTFVQAGAQFDPDWPLRPRIGEPWFGSGRNPTGTPRPEDGGGGGMLTMGLTGKMVTNYVGDCRLRSFGGRFRAQVWPGDTLTAQAEVVGIRNDDDGVGVRTERAPEATAAPESGATQ